MLQVSHDYRTGSVQVVDVPPPVLRPGGVLVRTVASLISTGTERGKIALARKSLLAKARERPDAVRQVIDTVRREGVLGAYRRVKHRLDQLAPLGYSAAGVVTGVGDGVSEYRVGDPVAVGGGGYANHAEILWVPRNLVARVPDGVDFGSAAFATVASIALHSLRLGGSGMAETVGVVGLGLIGQLAVRLALAAGCRVVACDPVVERGDLAALPGVSVGDLSSFASRVHGLSDGIGADVVLVTAASASSDPMRLAVDVVRDRGTVVVVGAVGMDLPRETLFRKEVAVVVSRSYGPGRYDAAYEERGVDYPVSYVRWTEGRNLGAVLWLLAKGRLDVAPLVSRRYPIAEAENAYEVLVGGDPSLIGVLLEYPEREAATPPAVAPRRLAASASRPDAGRARVGRVRLGWIGVGSFASNVLLPAFRAAGAEPVVVSSANGLSARDAVRRHGFRRAVASAVDVIHDPDVNVIVIATPHHLHTSLTLDALDAGKAVFVEKPLAIRMDEFERLAAEVPRGAPLFVGFNRRFSPHVQLVASWLAIRGGAATVAIRVNAGAVPRDSWIHDPDVGGGRLVGEGCHFVDLAGALLGLRPVGVRAMAVGRPDPAAELQDSFTIVLDFPDGSLVTVVYAAKGDTRLEKERVEVFADGWSAVIEDFTRTVLYRAGKRQVFRRRNAKGHREEVEAFVAAVRSGGPMPVAVDDLLASTAATLLAQRSVATVGERYSVSWGG